MVFLLIGSVIPSQALQTFESEIDKEEGRAALVSGPSVSCESAVNSQPAPAGAKLYSKKTSTGSITYCLEEYPSGVDAGKCSPVNGWTLIKTCTGGPTTACDEYFYYCSGNNIKVQECGLNKDFTS